MKDPHSAFRALADPTRRAILVQLLNGPRTIGEIAEGFAMTRPAVKKHLAVLEEGELIRVIPEGRKRLNQIAPAGLAPVIGWLATFDAFWDARLSTLKSVIEQEETHHDRPRKDRTRRD